MEWVNTRDRKPEDGQTILYYFEPFDKVYCGTFSKGEEGEWDDHVSGYWGFTTILPECPYWAPMPTLPEELK